MADSIAIIGVFFVPAAMIVLIVWFKSNERRKRYQLQAEVYTKALEKGQSVPDDLFVEPKKKDASPLNTGIICIAIGVGLSIFIGMVVSIRTNIDEAIKIAGIGIIPLLIGIAFVIIHFIEKRKAKNEDAG